MRTNVIVKMVSMVYTVRTTSTTALRALARTMVPVTMVLTILRAYVLLVLRANCATSTSTIAPRSLASITVHVWMTPNLSRVSV